jgi:uncharacterized protein YndB with AHSA1/START domain
MSKPQFAYVTYIATTPEKLWEALTSAEFTRQYWGRDWPDRGMHRSLVSDWQPGAEIKMLMQDGETEFYGEVLEADPPRRLSYTFKFMMGDVEAGSRVTFDLEPNGSIVKLSLLHEDFSPESVADHFIAGISNGWPAILSCMKSLLETGKPLDLTKTKMDA